jgi:hypothetical protein
MFRKKPFYVCLVALILMMTISACGNSATPTPTETLAPTETSEPTETLAPVETELPPTEALTETPAVMDQTATSSDQTLQTPPAASTVDPAAGAASSTPAAPATGTTPAAPAAGAGSSSVADKETYIGQNLFDNIQVRPGATLTIQWSVKNSGTTGWTSAYTLRYFSGIKADKDYYNFLKAVPAGQTTTFTITIVAPTTLGTYNTWWKLTNPESQNFGDVDFTFIVTDNPQKFTVTPVK